MDRDPAVSIVLAEFDTIDPQAETITNRAGLIHALTEAAELEHGLLVQYLFAAFSIRRGSREGLTIPQAESLRRWEASILKVARDEMGHLGTVCNLLTAIGGAPQFRRPNLPAPNRYFPQAPPATPPYRPFSLEPFSLATVERFVAFESPPRPKIEALRVVEPVLRYATIRDLYTQIKGAFTRLDRNGSLFISPATDQDEDDWSQALKLLKVTDLSSAVAAIDSIVVEGEGSLTGGPSSHYERFKAVRDELKAEVAGDASFRPARPVLPNPLTRARHDCPGVPLVDHPNTKLVSELFNWVYATMLLMLLQYYAFSGDTEEQRVFLRATIRRLMSGVIRPLGEVLTELPAHEGSPEPTAGPSFELYADVRLPSRRDNAWTLFGERLVEAADACGRLLSEQLVPARLGMVHENLVAAARSVARER